MKLTDTAKGRLDLNSIYRELAENGRAHFKTCAARSVSQMTSDRTEVSDPGAHTFSGFDASLCRCGPDRFHAAEARLLEHHAVGASLSEATPRHFDEHCKDASRPHLFKERRLAAP
jgi:hypothetical protein